MGDTTISWTQKTWNPVRGCSRVSPGCGDATGGGCYAMKMAHRFSGKGQPYEGLTRIGKRGVDWAGFARLVPEQLGVPLRWRRPRRIFVNSMSDLFHESLSDADIMRVWLVMARCPHHTFQVLTKRAKRMSEWVAKWCEVEQWEQAPVMARGPDAVLAAHTSGRARMFAEVLRAMGEPPPGAAFPTYDWQGGPRWLPLDLPNVWLGVSAEDQQRADARIPHLLSTPAAVRFVSVEPQIGPVDLDAYVSLAVCVKGGLPGLDWVIVGGESGPKARPFDLAWARSLVEQCKASGTACFVKQMGARPFNVEPDGLELNIGLRDRAGADPAEWPEYLRVRQFPA